MVGSTFVLVCRSGTLPNPALKRTAGKLHLQLAAESAASFLPHRHLGHRMSPVGHLLDRVDLELFREARLRLLRFHQHLHETSF